MDLNDKNDQVFICQHLTEYSGGEVCVKWKHVWTPRYISGLHLLSVITKKVLHILM